MSIVRTMGAGSEWWRSAVFYQIYVRSFQDSNGDGVGDLRGILARLDHLNDGTPGSLGVDALWLTPVHPSPNRDWGYDVSDYRDVHPRFGSLADLDALIRAAHEREMRLILDLVPNHTSDQHPWFRSSRASRTSPYRDWYVWRDASRGGGPPNNWLSSFGGPAWTFDETTGQYYLHSFLPQQPDLNYRNPAVVAAMEDVLRFWLDRGVDGFRVDVVHRLFKDVELRDNPPAEPDEAHLRRKKGGFRRLYDQDQPEVHGLLRRWRRILDSYPGDRMMVGEVYLFDEARLAAYLGTGDELNLAFDFPFLWSPWKAAAFQSRVDEMEARLPVGAWPTWALSNHDAPRHRSRFDHPGLGEARARLAALLLLTLRGTPFLYYGEEIGMTDAVIPPEQTCDPVGRDAVRSPMQWDAGSTAGFTTADEPWLPVAAGADRVNVLAQRDDPGSLFSFYRRLIWFRKGTPALTWGGYRPIEGAPGTLMFFRTDLEQSLLVAMNFADEPRELRLPAAGLFRIVFGTTPGRDLPVGDVLVLGPAEGVILERAAG